MEQEPKEKQPGCSSAQATGYATKVEAALAWFDGSYRESDAIDDARQLGHADNSDQEAVSATAGRYLADEVHRLRALLESARASWLKQADLIDWCSDNEQNTKVGYARQDARSSALRECAAALRGEISQESHNDEAERTAIAGTVRRPEVCGEVLGRGRANGRYGRSLQRLVS